jgi:hypothetical protein
MGNKKNMATFPALLPCYYQNGKPHRLGEVPGINFKLYI